MTVQDTDPGGPEVKRKHRNPVYWSRNYECGHPAPDTLFVAADLTNYGNGFKNGNSQAPYV
ncbi:hypothetical protein AG1IA_04968 [Rhizoctonia solani AG-1 IA]|uniref:Uncharacterized protein n=1 Tax=Thanatephorus cucumeris (strain AG1-IA) TaxID=983506 RepID=L8WSP1_THACA|nr:hypothetical protein AG1IA_04968 [Rhizoctonia solani AG-1 IA]